MVNYTGISYDYLINWSLYELHLPPFGNNAWLSLLHNLSSCWLNHNICWVFQRLGRSGDPSLLRWRSIGRTVDELSRRTLQKDLSLSKRAYQVLVKYFGGGFNVLFKKTNRMCLEFLKLIIHDLEFFERLQNLWYRSTHSCTNILIWGYFGLKNWTLSLAVSLSDIKILIKH